MSEELFNGKYKIKSTRLKNFDYSSNGAYFVTICTRNRKCYLGDIVNGKIKLSGIGEIVRNYWYEIPNHYKNVSLDEYIIMPNHVHGVIVINHKSSVETPHWGVSTGIIDKTQIINNNRNPHHKPQWKPNSLGSIICQFKSIVTKRIRTIGYLNFAWQSRFYEHIIRNGHELNRIREYIANNPLQWELDKNNPFLS